MRNADRLGPETAQWETMASQWGRFGKIGAAKSARDFIAAGLQLMMLKQSAPNGGFLDKANALGLSATAASRRMHAARRFARLSDAFVDAAGHASKLVCLLALDDAEVCALNEGREARGLTLERIAGMDARQLRRALGKGVQSEKTKPTRLQPEEERLLRRYRQCDHVARGVLLGTAGLLAERGPATKKP